jgi:hypothetical protein
MNVAVFEKKQGLQPLVKFLALMELLKQVMILSLLKMKSST